jgi:hypothetical protein
MAYAPTEDYESSNMYSSMDDHSHAEEEYIRSYADFLQQRDEYEEQSAEYDPSCYGGEEKY